MIVIFIECLGCINLFICKLVKEFGRRFKYWRRDNKGCVRLFEISNLIFCGEIGFYVRCFMNSKLIE